MCPTVASVSMANDIAVLRRTEREQATDQFADWNVSAFTAGLDRAPSQVRPTAYRLCESRELQHVRIVNSIRVRSEDLRAFLERRKRPGLTSSTNHMQNSSNRDLDKGLCLAGSRGC
jgi:hypothetical protein